MGMSIDPNHWETVKVAITNIGPHCHPSDIETLDCRNRDPTLRQILPQDQWEAQDNNILDITSHGLDVLQHIRAHLEQFMPDLDVTVSCHRTVKEQVSHSPTTQDISRSKD